MIMYRDFFYEFLYLFAPLIGGLVLGLIGLLKKFPTVQRDVLKLLSTWCYVLFAAGSSYIIAEIMRFLGTRIIEHDLINAALIGIISPSLFIVIITRFSFYDIANDENLSQLKVIRDHIFEYLNASIARAVMQRVESKIKDLSKKAKIRHILKEANRLIAAPAELTEEQIERYRLKFDELESIGDAASIIRILNKYFEIDYIVNEMTEMDEKRKDDGRHLESDESEKKA